MGATATVLIIGAALITGAEMIGEETIVDRPAK